MEANLYPQWHSFTFMVLEKKPKGSEHPQGDRVLDCLSFSTQGMKIKGQPRFNKFEAVLSIPQDGSLIPAQVQVIDQQKDFFEVQFINPSTELLKKLSWWDIEIETDQPNLPPNQSVDSGV